MMTTDRTGEAACSAQAPCGKRGKLKNPEAGSEEPLPRPELSAALFHPSPGPVKRTAAPIGTP
jgi:hypothetical protein